MHKASRLYSRTFMKPADADWRDVSLVGVDVLPESMRVLVPWEAAGAFHCCGVVNVRPYLSVVVAEHVCNVTYGYISAN